MSVSYPNPFQDVKIKQQEINTTPRISKAFLVFLLQGQELKQGEEDIKMPFPNGLANDNNSCYQNVILQSLFFTPYLIHHFQQQTLPKKEEEETSEDRKMKKKVVQEFQNLCLQNIKSPPPPPLDSKLNAIPFRAVFHHLFFKSFPEGRESDPAEFFTSLLDTFTINEPTEKYVMATFEGTMTQSLTCQYPPYKTKTKDQSFLCLPVNPESNLLSSLDQIQVKEDFIYEPNHPCEFCHKWKHVIQHTFSQWPPILVIQIKRYTNHLTKNNTRMQFPITLDTDTNNNKSTRYQLYSIVIHQGLTLDRGHYMNWIRMRPRNTWKLFNDVTISKEMELGEVQKSIDTMETEKDDTKNNNNNNNNNDTLSSANAYILFYEKTKIKM